VVTASTKGAFGTYAGLAAANVTVSAALLLLLANTLSIEDYAIFGVVSTLAGLVLLVVNSGHKEALFKFASRSEEEALQRTAQSLYSWSIPFFLLAAALSVVSLWAGLASLMFLLVYVVIATTAVFRGRALYTRDAAMWPLYRAIWLAGCAATVFVGTPLSLTAVFGLGSLAALLTFFSLSGHKIVNELSAFPFQLSLPFANPVLRQFFLIEVATVAYIKVDVLLLALLGIPSADIASYFFSIQLFEAALLLLMPLGYLFFNRINGTDIPSSKRAAVFVFGGGVMLVSLMAMLGWSAVGMPLLETLFSHYVSSDATTAVLLIALMPWGLALLFSYSLVATDREHVVAWVFFIGLVLHLIFNTVFIPTWGVQGAAWARVATECFIASMLFAAVIKTGSLWGKDQDPQDLV
jgi:O-antigen/teichoic acid export membrane protein